MRISIDGGALGAPSYRRFGTYATTINLLHALAEFDTHSTYDVYSFVNRPEDCVLGGNLFYKRLLPKPFWMSLRVSWEEMINRHDIFLALNQAIPAMTRARVIAFSHGISFALYPHYYKDSYKKMMNQVRTMNTRARAIVVSSERVKEQYVKKIGGSPDKIHVLPFGIPYDCHEYKRMTRGRFFLFVGMNHPVKNVQGLVRVFQKCIKQPGYEDVKLVLVGPLAGYKKKSANIEVHQHISRSELIQLYRQASAYVTTSRTESFNFPALEALSQKCPVIAPPRAIIPEMQSYVTLADTDEQMLKSLKNAVDGKRKPVPLDELATTFSWQTFVTKLTELYKRI